MDQVHEGVHGLGPQGWSMDWGSMFLYSSIFQGGRGGKDLPLSTPSPKVEVLN